MDIQNRSTTQVIHEIQVISRKMTKETETCFSFGDSPERALPVEVQEEEHGHAQEDPWQAAPKA